MEATEKFYYKFHAGSKMMFWELVESSFWNFQIPVDFNKKFQEKVDKM